jgi:hypothetical protein
VQGRSEVSQRQLKVKVSIHVVKKGGEIRNFTLNNTFEGKIRQGKKRSSSHSTNGSPLKALRDDGYFPSSLFHLVSDRTMFIGFYHIRTLRRFKIERPGDSRVHTCWK